MGKTEMRNWIDNIPAISGQRDFQRSSWDMVEAAQEAMSTEKTATVNPYIYKTLTQGERAARVAPKMGFKIPSADDVRTTIVDALSEFLPRRLAEDAVNGPSIDVEPDATTSRVNYLRQPREGIAGIVRVVRRVDEAAIQVKPLAVLEADAEQAR